MIVAQVLLQPNVLTEVYHAHLEHGYELWTDIYICNQDGSQWSTLDVAFGRKGQAPIAKDYLYRGYSMRPHEVVRIHATLRENDTVYVMAITARVSVGITTEEIFTPRGLGDVKEALDTLVVDTKDLLETERARENIPPFDGHVTEYRKVIDAVPAISTAIYASGDALGGLLVFDGAPRVPGGTGIIEGLLITDRASQQSAMDLVLFSSTFAVTADNAAFDPNDADLDVCIGVIPVTAANYWGFNDNSVANVYPISLPFPTLVDDKIRGQLVVRGTPTYATTSDIRVRLSIRLD